MGPHGLESATFNLSVLARKKNASARLGKGDETSRQPSVREKGHIERLISSRSLGPFKTPRSQMGRNKYSALLLEKDRSEGGSQAEMVLNATQRRTASSSPFRKPSLTTVVVCGNDRMKSAIKLVTIRKAKTHCEQEGASLC